MAWYDLQGSIKNVPSFNSENHPWGGGLTTSPEYAKFIATTVWQSALHGMGATSVWIWDRQLAYAKQEDFYNVMFTTKPDHLWKLSRTSMDLNRLSRKIKALQDKVPEVAVIYSEAARDYSSKYMDCVMNVYKQLLYNGKKVKFVVDSKPQDMQGTSLLIVPDAVNVPAATLEAINNYANNGGKVLILGVNSLSLNEHNQAQQASLLSNVLAKSTVINTAYNGDYTFITFTGRAFYADRKYHYRCGFGSILCPLIPKQVRKLIRLNG